MCALLSILPSLLNSRDVKFQCPWFYCLVSLHLLYLAIFCVRTWTSLIYYHCIISILRWFDLLVTNNYAKKIRITCNWKDIVLFLIKYLKSQNFHLERFFPPFWSPKGEDFTNQYLDHKKSPLVLDQRHNSDLL